jgi:hypothetical protein
MAMRISPSLIVRLMNEKMSYCCDGIIILPNDGNKEAKPKVLSNYDSD